MRPIDVFEDDRVKVTATLVQHAPVFPAFAFRFDTDTGSVTFSGDTGPSENLVELATGSDILVHEAIAAQWVAQRHPEPRDDAAEAEYQHLIGAHTTIEDVGGVAERAGVKKLVLNHLVPGAWPVEEWRRPGRTSPANWSSAKTSTRSRSAETENPEPGAVAIPLALAPPCPAAQTALPPAASTASSGPSGLQHGVRPFARHRPAHPE